MQYRHGHAEVFAEGFGETAEFTIAASGKAFKSLIDGLYSRKVEAAVRELSTNMFDAHIAAGVIQPCNVHLPTTLSPLFSIRDFGTGMSHPFMMKRYTTLFDSTKDGQASAAEDTATPANKQVGMLGLGRMSFFAYTDSCSITIWQDGSVRHYVVSMGKGGAPKIDYAGSAESDEPRGTKIEFAVKQKDIDEFRRSAIRVFKGFPLLPNGLPVDVVTALTEKPSHVGPFWKAYPASYLPDGGFYAKQGCVLYPIDLSLVSAAILDEDEMDAITIEEDVRFKGVPKELHPSRVAEFQALSANLTVVLDFPIGSLEFDVSRERLAYTDDTVMALRQQWIKFVKSLDATYERTFAKCRTEFQQLQQAKGPLFDGLGVLFTRTSYSYEAEVLNEFLATCFAKDGTERGLKPLASVIQRHEGQPYYLVYSYQTWKTNGAPKKHNAFLNSVMIYIDEDTKKRTRQAKKIIQHWLNNEQDQYERAFIINKRCLSSRLHKAMGRPPVVRLSSLPDLPANITAKPRGGNNGGGGAFHRIKLITPNLTTTGAVSDADYAGHLFAFMNKSRVEKPDNDYSARVHGRTVYPDYAVEDVMLIHQLLKRTTGQSISFINTRSNEPLTKWADYPLFYGCIDDLPQMMSDGDVRQFIAILNWDRFERSEMAYALQALKVKDGERNPITDLRRFNKRRRAMPVDDQTMWFMFLMNDNFKHHIGPIIDRAVAMGLEVLPPRVEHMQHHGFFIKQEEFVTPILPKRWMKVAKVCRTVNNNKQFIHQLLKDYASC